MIYRLEEEVQKGFLVLLLTMVKTRKMTVRINVVFLVLYFQEQSILTNASNVLVINCIEESGPL